MRIETEDGTLEVSPEHLIYLNDNYQFAKHTQVGDKLEKFSGTSVVVTSITSFKSKGVYAPITSSGEMQEFFEMKWLIFSGMWMDSV